MIDVRDSQDPPFNEFLCPQLKDLTPPLPKQSEYAVKAKALISSSEFDNVYDWRYPWQTMPNYDVGQYKARNAVRDNKLRCVDHYELRRTICWNLVDYFPMPEGVTASRDINMTYGVSVSHSQSQTVSISEDLGFTLGLNLAPNFLGAIKAAAYAAALTSANGGGGGIFPAFDFGFSANLSRQMSFTVEDQRTWDFAVSKTETVMFDSGYYYLYWQLCEGLALYAADKNNQDPTLLSMVPVHTHVKQFQSLPLSSVEGATQHPLYTPQYTLDPGCSNTYCTFPAGMPNTMLYVKGSALGEGRIACRPVLCCAKQEEHKIPQGDPQVKIKLKGTGALNVVTNTGALPLVIWTNL